MKQDFTQVMRKRTDEELIKIVTVHRENYQPEAIQAAEKEIELRKIDNERIETVKEKLTIKEQEQKTIDSNVVNSWTRFVHFIVDLIAFIVLSMILSLIFELFVSITDQPLLGLMGYGLLFVAFFSYYVFMEYKYQKTIGKFLTKTKVVMKDGQRPELNDIIVRTLCRLIPFDRLSYLFTRNGFHDYLSKTTVIKEN